VIGKERMNEQGGITPGKGFGNDRLRVIGYGRGWRVADSKGRLHSARIADKDRAQRQADAMNARLEAIGRLAPES
jgi:hypothetical protein